MKGLFHEFDQTSDNDKRRAWSEGFFVLDTNVLLDAYRYQVSTRNELFRVLERLKSRLWIPHHVALEYHRNRATVVAEQKSQFKVVERIVDKSVSSLRTGLEDLRLETRHASVRPHDFLKEISEAAARFRNVLKRLEAQQPGPDDDDVVKQTLERLFDAKVGNPPASQEMVDRWYEEASRRYEAKVPPGYADERKGVGTSAAYMHGGILYHKKYGDFVMWRQVMDMAKAAKWKSLILVTSDIKEDWWQTLKCGRDVTMGPRVELREEAFREAGIETLLMYKGSHFLKTAGEFLEQAVSPDVIQEVSDVANAARPSPRIVRRPDESDVLGCVLGWLRATKSAGVGVEYTIWPDFEIKHGDGVVEAYHVMGEWAKEAVTKGVSEFYKLARGDKYKRIALVFYVTSPKKMARVLYEMKRRPALNVEDERICIVVGAMENLRGGWMFIPIVNAERGRVGFVNEGTQG